VWGEVGAIIGEVGAIIGEVGAIWRVSALDKVRVWKVG
jgi:hypothetical protein